MRMQFKYVIMQNTTEQVILVNENDEEISTAEKIYAHQNGLLHRAFSIFIFRTSNGKIETLLQQRQNDKYHCANLWTNTCCSHPRPDEKVMDAAKRRLQEEMGITSSLQYAGKFIYRANLDNGLIEHELDHVFIGEYLQQKIQINKNEVADYCWMSIEQLKNNIEKNPILYTPWLKQALEIAMLARI